MFWRVIFHTSFVGDFRKDRLSFIELKKKYTLSIRYIFLMRVFEQRLFTAYSDF